MEHIKNIAAVIRQFASVDKGSVSAGGRAFISDASPIHVYQRVKAARVKVIAMELIWSEAGLGFAPPH